MKARHRSLLFSFAATTCAVAAFVACSSSDEPRPAFEAPDIDSGNKANLPETSPPDEPAPPADGGEEDAKPPFDASDEPVTCATDAACAVELVAGDDHFCARMSDGTARCWGDNARGSLGTADAGTAPPDAGLGEAGVDGGPVVGTGYVVSQVEGLEDATQLSAGGTTTCAVVADGGVYCWGGNDKGQLGLQVEPALTDATAHPTPSVAALPGPAKRIDVGIRSACAVLTSGEVWCWGDNTDLQLGRSEPKAVLGPGKAALDGLDVVRTGSSVYNGFAITKAGDLASWGAVAGTKAIVSGRTSSIANDALPLAIGLSPVTSFAVSSGTSAHACAIVSGEVFCWGNSPSGALGSGLADRTLVPVRSHVESKIAWPQQVAAGGELTCVRLTDGTVQCSGDNARGALGRLTEETASWWFRPADQLTGHAVAVAVGKTTVCALLQGGRIACWGGNDRGELGQGVSDDLPHPTPVSIAF